MELAAEQSELQAVEPKMSYMRKVSKTLRRQLSRPVSKTVYNPTFDSSFDGVQQAPNQARDVEAALPGTSGQQGAMQPSGLHNTPRGPQARPSFQLTPGRGSPGAAAEATHQAASRPMVPYVPTSMRQNEHLPSVYSVPMKSCTSSQQPVLGGSVPPAHPQQWQQGTWGQVASSNLQPPAPGSQMVAARPPRQGTRSGPYQGYASGSWLEIEMRNDVDDLAHNVDKYVTRRTNKASEENKNGLLEKIAQLEKRSTQQLSKIQEMTLLLPDEDGQYKLLTQELKSLEQDCDFYYNLYQQERTAKEAAQQSISEAIGHLNDIEVEFIRIKQLVEAPLGNETLASDTQGMQNHDTGQGLPQLIRPEDVLAAEKAVGGMRLQPWPDLNRIFVRLALVLLFLGCIAGAILGTYYVTKK